MDVCYIIKYISPYIKIKQTASNFFTAKNAEYLEPYLIDIPCLYV